VIRKERVENMARFAVVWCAVAVLLCAVAGGSWLEDANPIRMVSDVEGKVIEVIGQCRSAVSFARFVGRFGKSYRNEEEMKRRYEIFSQNLRLIRAHNKKRLPYTLAVNRMYHSLNLRLFLFLPFLPFDFYQI